MAKYSWYGFLEYVLINLLTYFRSDIMLEEVFLRDLVTTAGLCYVC